MNLFDTPGADAAYNRWLEPSDQHELDECEGCHEAGIHSNPLDFKGCLDCRRSLAERVRHVNVEYEYSLNDVDTAKEWADKHKYRYDSPEHLLTDAMQSKVITPSKSQTIY